MIAWTLFLNPIELSSTARLPLMIPLCLAVAICYKTIRAQHISDAPKESIWVFAYIIAGLTALGVLFWLIITYWT